MTDADHVALAVENWARMLHDNVLAMLDDGMHRRGSVEVFEDMIDILSSGFGQLRDEMEAFRCEN